MLTTLLLALLLKSLLALNLFQESEIAADFNDLGKLLLGGFAAAVAIAIAFTFIKLRLRDRKPATSDFVSIGHHQEKD